MMLSAMAMTNGFESKQFLLSIETIASASYRGREVLELRSTTKHEVVINMQHIVISVRTVSSVSYLGSMNHHWANDRCSGAVSLYASNSAAIAKAKKGSAWDFACHCCQNMWCKEKQKPCRWTSKWLWSLNYIIRFETMRVPANDSLQCIL